jgi:hypothetical protein
MLNDLPRGPRGHQDGQTSKDNHYKNLIMLSCEDRLNLTREGLKLLLCMFIYIREVLRE